jgi:integrase
VHVTGAGVEHAREMRHVSVPELLRLAGLAPDRYRAMVLLAGFGGLRWGELVGLRRRHVDLAHATVTVAGQVTEVGGRFIAGPPKTSAGLRTLPLPAVVLTALVEHLDRHAQPGPDAGTGHPTHPTAGRQPASAGERAKGIEPSPRAWEARVLPLNYARRRQDSSRPPELGQRSRGRMRRAAPPPREPSR